MSNQAAIKLHRRVVRLDDANWTLLSLRPGDPGAFATVRSDETWHVLGGPDEAEMLARMFWALAFQRHERTLILIDAPFLVPNPHDSEPSSPVLLVNSDLGTPRRHALDELRGQLPLASPSLGTVKLRTVGLDRALEDPKAHEDRSEQRAARLDPHQWREWMDRVHGIIVYAAPGAVLRRQAVLVAELSSYLGDGTAPTALAVPIIERSLRVRGLREQRFHGRTHLELTDDERKELGRLGAAE